MARAAVPRKNHYIPVCYQLAFADSSGKVWVKFRGKSGAVHLDPTGVGHRHNLYIRRQHGKENDAIEKFLGRDVEDAFAALSRRIRDEQMGFRQISSEELGALAKFVASQTVRTLAHKRCIDQQAGRPVNANTFTHVMLKMMQAIYSAWAESHPAFYFYTSLPHVGSHFITGDNPVAVIQFKDDQILFPEPVRLGITPVGQILKERKYAFGVPLSPYVAVFLHGYGDGSVHLPGKTLQPWDVNSFNRLVRAQSEIFTLAKDEGSLM